MDRIMNGEMNKNVFGNIRSDSKSTIWGYLTAY